MCVCACACVRAYVCVTMCTHALAFLRPVSPSFHLSFLSPSHVCTTSHQLRFMLLDLHTYTSHYAPLRSRAIHRLVILNEHIHTQGNIVWIPDDQITNMCVFPSDSFGKQTLQRNFILQHVTCFFRANPNYTPSYTANRTFVDTLSGTFSKGALTCLTHSLSRGSSFHQSSMVNSHWH